MGTPEFAVESLDILVQNKYDIAAVITTPDKPAGRGQHLHQSAVKKYAVEKGLFVLQPEKLKDSYFISQLMELKADLQIVVAFRMLPEIVWKMPAKGTINLHASLLPNYRGAAPINWAIINGEKETGVTTFFLQQEIDTGKIIYQEKTPIEEKDNAGSIHDKLMHIGAGLILKTFQAIEKNDYPQIDQSDLITPNKRINNAPKIFKDNCFIDWNLSADQIYNFIRGLSPYPGAILVLSDLKGNKYQFKIFDSQKEIVTNNDEIGIVKTDSKTYLKIAVKDGYIFLLDLQLAGKKRMSIADFLRGFPINNQWKISFNNKVE